MRPCSGFWGRDLAPKGLSAEVSPSSEYAPTFISRKFLRDLRCYTNSYGENAECRCGAPPITMGASAFYPLVVNPIQNQYARELTPPLKEGKPSRNERDKGEKLEESRTSLSVAFTKQRNE